MKNSYEYLAHKAYRLRTHSIESTTAAGSGHPTSCLSAADIVAALFFDVMHIDLDNPLAPTNDRFILSKGHAAPLLYAAYAELGLIPVSELKKLRSFDSVLEGHPTPRLSLIDFATGSLGMGLSYGVGTSLYARKNKLDSHTYVLMGDGEIAEGSVWEAASLAAFYKLDNLTVIVDSNRLGQSGETSEGRHIEIYRARWEAFGWHVCIVDGHDIKQILDACAEAKTHKKQPTVIVARTIKGFGLTSFEDKEGFHGHAIKPEELPAKLQELRERFPEAAAAHFPEPVLRKNMLEYKRPTMSVVCHTLPSGYKKGEKIATRQAVGTALAAYGAQLDNLICLDADVKNSTYTELFQKTFPDRFVECFIAEQTMIGAATGLAAAGAIACAATFGAFMTRAHDQIRMAAIGRIPLRLIGSHAGVAIGQDGPSQMALEDIALMRCLPDSVVLSPADGVSAYALTACMLNNTAGITYLRTMRSATPVIYNDGCEFKIGGCSVLKQSTQDRVCIIATGAAVFQALAAHEALLKRDIAVSVIDCYSIKPLDVETIRSVARASGGKIITVEDHYAQGGLGEAICHALAQDAFVIKTLAVEKLPRSGTSEELARYENIEAQAIVESVNALV